jgi:hypothetical protein
VVVNADREGPRRGTLLLVGNVKLSELEAIRARIVAHDDRTLLKIVTIEAADYREDVLDLARAEVLARGLEMPSSTKEYLSTLGADELHESELFCDACHAATTDEAFPATGEMFFRQLRKAYAACPRCGSVVRDHCITVFRIPFVLLARYRVKQLEVPWPGQPKILASRRLDSRERVEPRVDSAQKRKRALKRKRRRRRTEDAG